MEILAYACALAIGLIMGLSGAGGAILTVPVLVYLTGIEPVTATAYSLFIVGMTSIFGTVQNLRKGTVMLRTGLLYAIPSVTGVLIARRLVLPALPETIFTTSTFTLTKGSLLMIIFSMLMLIAALSLLRTQKQHGPIADRNKVWLALQIFLAGLVVGLVGAGGGFLFVPMLIFVARMPMKNAAATSLMIIALNSMVGFAGSGLIKDCDWPFLLIFSTIAIGGILAGIKLGHRVNDRSLKRGFGWFVLVMSLVIFTTEVLLPIIS